MGRATSTQAINTFIGGLITEATELTQPRNSSVDEDNCLLLNEGNRTRRRGVDFEPAFDLSPRVTTETEMETFAVNTFTWRAVAGDGSRNFVCVQVGNFIDFYDLGATAPLSANPKVFSIDLNTYLAPAFVTAEDAQVEFASGKGFLFIASEKIEPLTVEYDPVADGITVTQVTIQIRDFEGLDDGLAVDEEPAALAADHEYNLINQGWGVLLSGLDPVFQYFQNSALYPPNNLQWFLVKSASGGTDIPKLRQYVVGNTEAPKGHFIVDAFNIDRSAVSGIAGLTAQSVDQRPKAVAFFAGRVWWAGADGQATNSDIYFSQVLKDIDRAGLCYQVADPTAEDDPLLVDSDGGVVTIPEIGSVKKMIPVGASLVVFANNGVFQITGPDDVFKATNFSVRKITTEGVENSNSIVNVGSSPIWWSDSGILSITADEISLSLSAVSVSENTIQSFYNDIPAESKRTAKGVYDNVAKKVVWLYRSTAANGTDTYRYDKALWLDTNIQAFYPWSITSLAVDSPYIASVFTTPEASLGQAVDTVVDDILNVVEDDVLNTVVVNINSFFITETVSSIRFLGICPDGLGDTNYSFADFTNKSLVDWESKGGTEGEYSSYAETWWELNEDITRYIQAPFIYTYLKRTEQNFVATGGGAYETDCPSSLLVQGKWDWADSIKANKWSRQFQAYKFRQNLIVDPLDLTLDTGYPTVTTRNKMRGKGRALQIRFESEGTKDFNLLGWAVIHEGNTAV